MPLGLAEEPAAPTVEPLCPPPADEPPVPRVEAEFEPEPEPAAEPPVPTLELLLPPPAEVPPVPYGTWELLRKGKDCAILAVGVMCKPAVEAAELLAADGLDVSVVNARFLKPMDREILEGLSPTHKLLVTVEDGTVVNGFGAALAALVQTTAPDVRVVALGVPDRTYEHAPRAQQLADVGLTGAGIAARIRALAAEESLSTR